MKWLVLIGAIAVGWTVVYLLYRARMRRHEREMREAGLAKYQERDE